MVDLSESTEFKSLGNNKNKRQIIIVETKRGYKNYINSLKYRYNKKNPYLPNFLLTKNSEIYKILDAKEYSAFMGNIEIDKNSIIIAIENYGWLNKNAIENKYTNWIGDIYKEEVYEKKWRDKIYWDKYQKSQIEKLSELILELCMEFDIPTSCVDNNVRQEGVERFLGVTTRSNFDFIHKDVNPSFDFKLLKKKLENDKSVR